MKLTSAAQYLAFGLVVSTFAAACGGDDKPNPRRDAAAGSGGAGGTAGSGGRGGTGGTGGAGGSGATGGTGGAGGSGGTGGSRDGGAGTGGRGGSGGSGGTGGSRDGGPGPDAGIVRMDASAPQDASPPDVAPVITMIPGPFAGQVIGSTVMGSAVITPTAWTITAPGAGVTGTTDSFHFVNVAMTGDGEVIGRVNMLTGGDPMALAGVMMRATLDANAPNVFLAARPDATMAGVLQSRSTAGGMTTAGPADLNVKTARFLRLTRAGRVFTAATSSDGSLWARVGSVELDMPAQIFVGAATEAHSATMTTMAVYNYLSVSNVPASMNWTHFDLGTMGGAALYNATTGVLDLTGFGQPWTATQDFLTYAQQNVSGDFTLTAKVASISGTDPSARAGLMFRVGQRASASRSAPFAAMSVTKGMGAQFHHSAVARGGERVTIAGPTAATTGAPIWLRIEKADIAAGGSQFTGAYSADGTAWTNLHAVQFSVTEPLMVGLFSAASSTATSSTARFESISFRAGRAHDGGAPTAQPQDAGATPDAAAVSGDGGVIDAAAGN